MTKIIYFDHASTTPLHPDVKKAMDPFLDLFFGNPSSIHSAGRQARSAVDLARSVIAEALGAHSREIVFTSGGTEANNLALMGVARAYRSEGKNHIITSRVEHYAVLKTCREMESMGFRVTYLPVDQAGVVDVAMCAEAITEQTALISIMYGNNEVGTRQPMEELGRIARDRGVFFHTDAIQAFGMEKMDVKELGIDLLSLSGHKINGPKGIGALYVSDRVRVVPGIYGGNQERKRRAGTENVAGIVGLGKATELAMNHLEQHRSELLLLREAFLSTLEKTTIRYVVNGSQDHRLPHILNISFLGVQSEALLMNLDLEGIACSGGSTCTSGVVGASHVLTAMKVDEDVRDSAVRFSFGRGNTVGQVEVVVKAIAAVIHRLMESGR